MNRTPATTTPAVGDGPEAPETLDALSLESVFARCQDELLGTLYYVTGNLEDARDALQEAFLKCWRRREELDDVKNLRAWVFQVTLNAGRDLRKSAWRRRKRPMDGREAELPTAEGGPEAEAGHREEVQQVRQALTDLPGEQREVFLLRQNGQLTYAEIAHALEIPEGTVKTRMRLALSKLRLAVQPSG
ncbi:MAG: RNA polymerase sigma factor [Pirellulales bacterium]|nr:RNA polymerase sigma factor [Pirellulales bacterium]